MNQNNQTQAYDDEIDLLALAGSLWDQRWLIIACTVLFAIIGVAYALLATPIYRATALIQVEEKTGGLPGMDDIASLLGSSSTAATEIELIKSRSVLGKVVDDLRLDIVIEPKYFPILGKAIARRSGADPEAEARSIFARGHYAAGNEQVQISRLNVPEWAYGKTMTFQVEENGWKLYDSDDHLVLEGTVDEPVENAGYGIMVNQLLARPGIQFRVTKVRRHRAILDLQQSISASERGKDSGIISISLDHEDYRLAERILDEVGRNYVLQNVERNSAQAAQSLEFLSTKLPEIKHDLEAAEVLLNDYQVRSESIDITSEAEALLTQVVELEKRISELDLQRAEIEQRFRATHPRYRAWASQMAELKERRAELDHRIGRLPETQQELVRLRRDVEVGNEIYLQMLANVQQLNIARAGTVGNVRVVDEAAVDIEEPVKPKKALIAIIATLLGGFIGVAIVLLREALNRGVENPEEIENIGLPVYASVPFSEAQQNILKHKTGRLTRKLPAASSGSKLLAAENPADLSIEALRSLRTSLHFGMMDAKNNVLMIAGPSPNVGKTFISTNLAAVIASAGQSVLLIDTDMRRGLIHEALGASNSSGLSDLLSGTATLEEVTRPTQVDGLSFVARGTAPPNPSELLMSKRFADFIEQVSKQYSLVIVDTPPILAVTDAAVVGCHAGTSMMVSRFGLNPAKEVALAKQRFEQNGVEIKGVVFNGVVRKTSTYSYGYYNYEYKTES